MSERIILPVQLVDRTVHVHPDLTPLRVRTLNLTAVQDALRAAGIDSFAVRALDDRAPAVGVRADQRAAVLRALAALAASTGAYLSVVLPKPSGRDLLHDGGDAKAWDKAREAKVLRLTWFRTDPAQTLVHGRDYGCDVEFWGTGKDGERIWAPRPNQVTRVLRRDDPVVEAPAEPFTRLAGPRPVLPPLRTRPEMNTRLPEDIGFPIDVVYTWVDGTDPAWQRRRAGITGETYHAESASAARFLSRDELRYSLRSLHANAPWVRKVWIVTDEQTPAWLDTAHPGVQVVSHKEIFADPSVLPVFNSHAIESQLHHIDGLAEHFLYFNDDMFIGRPLAPQAFFLANGLSKFFLSQGRVPVGPITDEDTPVDAAHKNNRRLLAGKFGPSTAQVFQHVPYALRRSVLSEIEAEFPQEWATTMASRFRSTRDLSPLSNLYHYYAYLSGRAVPGSVKYGYVQLAVPDLAARLSRALARRDWDAFCLNDAYSTEEQLVSQATILRPFLDGYFPVPSPYEKRG
ncbi:MULTISPECIES: stealth family protein [Actinoplanes]|uniref:stealth family protein n=1 Tax=Actinoplanes TaxID=1865 RepID=UPI0009F83636|nr:MULTISPECIES: stealth family protein [Actinoplanes]GLY01978.1 exopolysaccharide phosphotransferase [Actinoplanes sp. NBRC 101535]